MSAWHHINPTADQSHDWWRAGRCLFCGDRNEEAGCVCRYCDCCSQDWVTAGERHDGDDGRPHKQDCPECVGWLASEEGKAEMARQAAARKVRP